MAPVPEPTTPPRSPAASPFTLRAAFRRQTVLTIALPLLAVCVVIGIAGHAVLAGLLIAALLLVLAAVRLLLPTRAVGALAVRSRVTDTAVMLVMALAIGVLSGSPNL